MERGMRKIYPDRLNNAFSLKSPKCYLDCQVPEENCRAQGLKCDNNNKMRTLVQM